MPAKPTCTGGSLYGSFTGSNLASVGTGRWYLNTAVPTACGGKIKSYSLGTSCSSSEILIAMWQNQPGTSIYTKVYI